eukprot:Anaeramoba_flamelloidesa326262_79.p2 GENE.a326262_79~~a326262_79.p2  ORF type:complete len:133 (-),score=22.82 a326262_79:210-608(-)
MQEEFLKPFQHIKTLRAALKDVDSATLKKHIHKLNVICEEKEKQEETEAQQERERQERMKKAVAKVEKILDAEGLDIEDLVIAKHTKKRPPTHVLNMHGRDIFYVGTGRMPKEFEEYIANGGSLDDLKIKEE